MPTKKAAPKEPLKEATHSGSPIQNPEALPLMYVEQMIAVAIGPYVSKITLAIENTPGTLVPTVQIAMPTNTLHNMAKQIMHILSNPDTQKQLEQALTGSLNEMKS